MSRNQGTEGSRNANELSPSIRDPPMTRRRYATRSMTATAARENEKQTAPSTPQQQQTSCLRLLAVLCQLKLITKEEQEQYAETARTLQDEACFPFLKEKIGDEKLNTALRSFSSVANSRSAAAAAAAAFNSQNNQIRQGTPVGNLPMASYQAQFMNQCNTRGQSAARMMNFGEGIRPTAAAHQSSINQVQKLAPANLMQQWNSRQGPFSPYNIETKQEPSDNFNMGQKSAQTNIMRTRTRSQISGTNQNSGEVARTLMKSRPEQPMYHYQPGRYPPVPSIPQAKGNLPPGYLQGLQVPQGMTPAQLPNKRTAPTSVESNMTKSARFTKGKRQGGVEDPNAPDMGEMDAVLEASIHLADEQRALLSDIPSQVTSDASAQVIESNLLNVDAVKLKLHQLMREKGTQLAGGECIDVVVQGMEEKFEALIKKSMKLAMHRVDSSNTVCDGEKKIKTSEVKTKVREIKKQNEAQKANKLREEREKLEQLAETASKKDLANDKELAAKVERVKREKQLNAETEATNRALSNALGGLGFEKFHKMKRDKEAAAAAAAAASSTPSTPKSTTSTPQPPSTSRIRPPLITRPAIPPQPSKQREEKKSVVLGVKDILTAMSLDSHYCFSPVLYRILPFKQRGVQRFFVSLHLQLYVRSLVESAVKVVIGVHSVNSETQRRTMDDRMSQESRRMNNSLRDSDVGPSSEISAPVAPSSYYCPISMEIMVEPVMIATGQTYEKACIEKWLSQGHRTCPVTGQRLRHLELNPNLALRSAIQEWAEGNNVQLRSDGQMLTQYVTYHDEAPRNILQGHEEIVWAVEAYENWLFSASADRTIRVWDIESRRCARVLEDHSRPVLSLAIANNKLFSGSYDFTIKVWSLETLTKIKTLTGHTDAVRALAVAGKLLFSGSYDSTLRVWDVRSLEPIRELKGHQGPVRTLVYAGGLMFSGSYDKSVRVWDVSTLTCTSTLTGHAGAVRALVASNRLVFSGSDDHTIKVWSTERLACVRDLEGHEDNVRVLTVGDRYMFSGSWDKTIRVWDLETLECVKTLEGHTEAVLALAVGNRYLISGSYDTTVRFWELDTFRCVKKCEGHDDAVRVLAAANGKVFSGSYDGTIGVWL
eukprot:g1968.t1